MKKDKPIKRRIPLPKKPPKVQEDDTTYRRKPKHPKQGADEHDSPRPFYFLLLFGLFQYPGNGLAVGQHHLEVILVVFGLGLLQQFGLVTKA